MSLEEFRNFIEEIGFKETFENTWKLGNFLTINGKNINVSICEKGIFISISVTEFNGTILFSKNIKKWVRYQPEDLAGEMINEIIEELGYTPREIVVYMKYKNTKIFSLCDKK